MIRLRYLFPGVLSILWLTVVITVLVQHGGMHGDAHIIHTPWKDQPVMNGNEDNAPIYFNRWTVKLHQEPWPLTLLYYLSWPAFRITGITLDLLGYLNVQFQTHFPFGLSYGSYGLLIALPLSVFQWVTLGWVADRLLAAWHSDRSTQCDG